MLDWDVDDAPDELPPISASELATTIKPSKAPTLFEMTRCTSANLPCSAPADLSLLPALVASGLRLKVV